jgi:hypothetical protein
VVTLKGVGLAVEGGDVIKGRILLSIDSWVKWTLRVRISKRRVSRKLFAINHPGILTGSLSAYGDGSHAAFFVGTRAAAATSTGGRGPESTER